MLNRIALGAAFAVLAAVSSAQLFTSRDKQEIRRTFSSQVRVEVGTPPYASNRGAWQVRLTAAGSQFLYKMAHADLGNRDWSDWVDAKVDYDRALAARRAAKLNGKPVEDLDEDIPSDSDFRDMGSVGGMVNDGTLPAGPSVMIDGEAVEDPGPAPDGLTDSLGDVPLFAEAVKPSLYKISFGDEPPVSFVDHAPVPGRYLYFRSSEGVISGGTPVKSMPADQLESVRTKAGIDDTTWHVMRSVSQLEGGFDSINTYDTGFVSVGFIQFTTGASGTGSLAKVLLKQKEQDPAAFERDFHRYGIEVTDRGVLAVYDAAHDQELVGKEAVQAVIRDKRLSAAFVRAGRVSSAFKAAQLQLARERYYPGDDLVAVRLGSQSTKIKVSDVVKSEAGLATLMDRKVNTGNTSPLASVLQRIADDTQATSASDLAAHEEEIVAALKFRRDFLADSTLTQPNGWSDTIASRGATYPRGARKPKPPKKKN